MTDDNKDNSNSNNSLLQIKPYDLKKRIDEGEDIFILDVRTPEEHKSWKVSYDRYQDSSVIPIDALSSADSLKQIPKDKEIVTFCGHGNRSMTAAKMLSALGHNAKSIEGGLDGWNSVYDIASISDMGSSPVRIWQIRRLSKGCMSYMVASTYDKSAIVIDATCKIDNVISKIVNENKLRITKVIDTHMHADHLSGATRLAKIYGAEVYISSIEGYNIKNDGGDKGLSFKSISDGDTIQVGDGVVLETIHTPGHTNGSMSFRLQNGINKTKTTTNSSNNIDKDSNHNDYLFTGDTLFVDGIGRPDLHNKAEEFTRNLYNTYHQKILNLPDETLILPAHFSGSFEHQKLISNTINLIKQKINLLSASEAEFIKFVIGSTSSLPQPMNYDKIISINKNMILCDTIEQKDIEAGPNACGIRA
jgi:glyoxylase-like metal-dependent hydrolase (beta-lactamase superfamily II)/rhodanese-related sulfurtransferase